MTAVDIPLDAGDFRIMKGKVAAVLRRMPEQHKFIRGQIAWAGFRQGYIEYDRDGRKSGKTGYSYAKMTRFASDGITSFSDFPLKLVTWSGFFVAFIAFIVAMYSLYSKFVLGGAVPGWASLMISLLFLGGVQLLSLGIMGEYISRIASNVRQRPLYVVDETNCEEELAS
jgi:dolichol-phosphate mannosyltransferase